MKFLSSMDIWRTPKPVYFQHPSSRDAVQSRSSHYAILSNSVLKFRNHYFFNFSDFQKAFDMVHKLSLWHIVRRHGIPQRHIFKSLPKFKLQQSIQSTNGFGSCSILLQVSHKDRQKVGKTTPKKNDTNLPQRVITFLQKKSRLSCSIASLAEQVESISRMKRKCSVVIDYFVIQLIQVTRKIANIHWRSRGRRVVQVRRVDSCDVGQTGRTLRVRSHRRTPPSSSFTRTQSTRD